MYDLSIDRQPNSNLIDPQSIQSKLAGIKVTNQADKLDDILITGSHMLTASLPDTNQKKIRIGELLVQKKIVSYYQLQMALELQRIHRQKLGEIFVQKNLLSLEDLERTLKEQYWRNAGFWVID